MRAFIIDQTNEFRTEVAEVTPTPGEPTDLLIRVDYSGVNFKDTMVAQANSRVRRIAYLIGGVDAAGEVLNSPGSDFTPGQRVAVHGGVMGVARDGGYAEAIYAPPRVVSALPDAISPRQAMIIGTAGFTAMQSILALEDFGLSPGARVLVTGATGGVGSHAITYLAARGYQPVASTGSEDEHEWLTQRGAVEVIGRGDVADRSERVLASERWDGAIDCVGGATLHDILRSLRYGAAVAASGLVASADLATTVYPFITRGVALLGVDSVDVGVDVRSRVWGELGHLAPHVDFDALVGETVSLEGLDAALQRVRSGSVRGRVLVDPRLQL